MICEHGERRITRLEADGSKTVLAEPYQGKRLDSPNDLWAGEGTRVAGRVSPARGRARAADSRRARAQRRRALAARAHALRLERRPTEPAVAGVFAGCGRQRGREPRVRERACRSREVRRRARRHGDRRAWRRACPARRTRTIRQVLRVTAAPASASMARTQQSEPWLDRQRDGPARTKSAHALQRARRRT